MVGLITGLILQAHFFPSIVNQANQNQACNLSCSLEVMFAWILVVVTVAFFHLVYELGWAIIQQHLGVLYD